MAERIEAKEREGYDEVGRTDNLMQKLKKHNKEFAFFYKYNRNH